MQLDLPQKNLYHDGVWNSRPPKTLISLVLFSIYIILYLSIMINLYLQRVRRQCDQNKTGNKSAITRPCVHKEEQ